MPAEFLTLFLRPFCPCGRYRHGFDPPGQLTRFPFPHTAFRGKPRPLPGPSNFIALPPISQQLRGGEPFLNLFRQTGTNHIFQLSYAFKHG